MTFYVCPLNKVLLSIVAISLLSACRSGEPTVQAGAPQAISVRLATVEQSTVRDSSEFVAQLQSRESVNLQPRVPGKVARIFVRSGDQVKAGTPILQIDRVQQEAIVQGSLAAVSTAEAELDAAQATLRTFQAERSERVANLRFSQQQRDRFASLRQSGAVSQQTLDEYSNRLEVARAGLAAVDAQIEAQQSAITRAQRTIQQAQANTRQESAQLDNFTVVAPFDGTIGEIPVKSGDVVDTSTRLATITQNANLEVNISIPADRSRDVQIGTSIELLDAQGQKIGTSEVFFIAPNVSANTQSILIKARLNNPSRELRTDKSIRARVIWKQRSGVKVPTVAISRIAGQPFVFVAEQDKTGLVVRQRPVKLGAIEGNQYQILEGLKPGDQIATTGLLQLSDGATITAGS
ncbi:efflux RND transporter periplasmic adaptor subunit [Leptolyngbya sp. AN03gr2]|uniref:efflux RND transporter periplasmic adaptor subunit n=1 Tax=unclassified Leptolyngbya TaxID=2650499 RepID=UPI003D32171B